MSSINENIFWSETKKKFEKETDLLTFKNWEVVRTIPIYVENEFKEMYSAEVTTLLQQLKFPEIDKWIGILKEPFLGHTEQSYSRVAHTIFNNVQCSSWTLKSAHHLLTFEQMSGKSIHNYDQIVDFGSGIGEVARIIRDLQFKGDYYIYDLPEVSRISKFYVGETVKTVDHFSQIPQNKNTLFIGTWSLSEVPFNYRDQIIAHLKGSDFLIVFQNTCFDYNNFLYFTEIFPYLSNTFYRLKKLFGNYGDSGSHYLIALGNKQ